MSIPTEPHPSPFYALLEGGSRFTLVFDVDAGGEGPICRPDGTLESLIDGQLTEAEVQALSLGADRYRLCEHNLFGNLNMLWGDEFFAVREEGNRLRLTGVVVPPRFQHQIMVLNDGIDPEGSLANLVHSFGGGWESFATNLVTITIPAENWKDFEVAADLYD